MNREIDAERSTLTQDDVAKLLGISRARVSFLERQALRKLRAAAEAKGYALEDVLGLGKRRP